MSVIDQIQFKRGTKEALERNLVADKLGIPARGEPIWESDYNRLKIGDGTHGYPDLPYLVDNTATVVVDNKSITINTEDALQLFGYDTASEGTFLKKTQDGLEWVTITLPDTYTKDEIDAALNDKQDALSAENAGEGISISKDSSGNVKISAVGQPAAEAYDNTVKLSEDLYTFYNIGKITGASNINPVKVGNKDETVKDVFNAIFGVQEDQDPTFTNNTKVNKVSQSTTSFAGGEAGRTVEAATATVKWGVVNTDSASYGLRTENFDTFDQQVGTDYIYPIKTKSVTIDDVEYKYNVRILADSAYADAINVTKGTLVAKNNSYLYCLLDANQQVEISYQMPETTSTTSSQTRFKACLATVEFNNATYSDETVEAFKTFLNKDYTADHLTHGQSSVYSSDVVITAGTIYPYSKLSPAESVPLTALTKQATTFSTNGADFSYIVGDYLYLYDINSNKSIQTNVLGQWVDVAFESLGEAEITMSCENKKKYFAYRVGPFVANGTAKYRLK